MIVKFEVMGEPRGKGRPKFARMGNFTRTYTPEQTVIYENLIRQEYKSQCENYRFGDDDALEVDIVGYYSIPKSASKKKRAEMLSGDVFPLKKVDVDNLTKVVLDALNQVAFRDDVQVVALRVYKVYAEIPKIEVTISNYSNKMI